jgi:hypothetical protein
MHHVRPARRSSPRSRCRRRGPGFQGEARGHAHKDAREGRKAPTARQRTAAARGGDARFNELGTPRMVTRDGAASASGLPADAAARAYLRGRRRPVRSIRRRGRGLELVSVAVTDCSAGTTQDLAVRAAELQAFEG